MRNLTFQNFCGHIWGQISPKMTQKNLKSWICHIFWKFNVLLLQNDQNQKDWMKILDTVIFFRTRQYFHLLRVDLGLCNMHPTGPTHIPTICMHVPCPRVCQTGKTDRNDKYGEKHRITQHLSVWLNCIFFNNIEFVD